LLRAKPKLKSKSQINYSSTGLSPSMFYRFLIHADHGQLLRETISIIKTLEKIIKKRNTRGPADKLKKVIN